MAPEKTFSPDRYQLPPIGRQPHHRPSNTRARFFRHIDKHLTHSGALERISKMRVSRLCSQSPCNVMMVR